VAVVEGVGDHGCEYMTGGLVAVLGKVGMNFGAGMTGGLAWVYDADGTFVSGKRYHSDFVDPEQFDAVDAESQGSLRTLIEMHVEHSGSGLGKGMLADWANSAKGFVRLNPKPQH
jgi:glutamate synthase (ferredoxin)